MSPRAAAGLVAAALLLLSTTHAYAATIRVPDDQPTIKAGIDAAAPGDTVLVACGTYFETRLLLKGGVSLRSETGLPDCVTVDGQSQSEYIFRGTNLTDPIVIEGFSIGNTSGFESLGGG